MINASEDVCASSSMQSSYGDPVLEWWRPGGSVLALKGQGSQAYLSLPPHCQGVSYSKAKQLGPHQGFGIREDERDGPGIGESRGKIHLTRVFERPSGDGVRPTVVGAWGRWMAPWGL